jgi:pectate lyase
MRKSFNHFMLLLLVNQAISLFSQDVPAFPGAEGYGKYVTGGRGGRVIYVTHIKDNLDKFGKGYKGSLRAALETPGNDPITIVFKCGGVISPNGTLKCERDNVTIAGQTALGNGICIKDYGINFSGNNIIVRYMRFRVGDAIMQNDPALTFSNGKKAIIDHCSFGWSVEENVNITDVDSVTLQWCINSESLYYSTHIKGERAYAAQWGGEHATYHHNLLAHHNSRMPRQNGNTSNDYQLTWDYRNNVHYNWGNPGAFYGGGIEQAGGFCHSNLVNNYYKPGPATTTNKSSQYFCAPSGGRPAVVGEGHEYDFGYGLWYLSGNVMYDNSEKTNDNWSGLYGPAGHHSADSFDAAPVMTSSAEKAYQDVLAYAGATKPRRDTIDTRIVQEVISGTATFGGVLGSHCGIIDSHMGTKPADAPPGWDAWEMYIEVDSIDSPLDTDRDGIPDWWEDLNGLAYDDPEDGRALASDKSGYTNLEEYLNSDDVGRFGPTPVSETDLSPMIDIYPSPIREYFTVHSLLVPEKIEIYSITGRKVAVHPVKGQRKYSLASLPDGAYIMKIFFTNGKYAISKIIKE